MQKYDSNKNYKKDYVNNIIKKFYGSWRNKNKTKSLIETKITIINENKLKLDQINTIQKHKRHTKKNCHNIGLKKLRKNLSWMTENIEYSIAELNQGNQSINSYNSIESIKLASIEKNMNKGTIKRENKLRINRKSVYKNTNSNNTKKKKIFKKFNKNENKYIITNKNMDKSENKKEKEINIVEFTEPYNNKNFYSEYFRNFYSSLNEEILYKLYLIDDLFFLEIKIINKSFDIEIVNFKLDCESIQYDVVDSLKIANLKNNESLTIKYKVKIKFFTNFKSVFSLQTKKNYNEIDYLKVLLPINFFNFINNPIAIEKELLNSYQCIYIRNVVHEFSFNDILTFELILYSKIRNIIKLSRVNYGFILNFKNYKLLFEIILDQKYTGCIKLYYLKLSLKEDFAKGILTMVQKELFEFIN